jgi:hypothetical protein
VIQGIKSSAFVGYIMIGFVVRWSFYGFRSHVLPNAGGEMPAADKYIRANGRPEMIQSLPAKALGSAGKL